MNQTKVIMSGDEAIARGAYEAGVTIAAAYPGTPSTEIVETIATYEDMYAQWSPNEKVALEFAFGASLGGARAIASMKHVGVNVAADPLITIAYAGVNGGLVLVSADDPHMFSSQNEQDNRNYARFAKIPLLEPASPQEAKEMTKHAFEISEQFDLPVLLRGTTRLCHGRGVVALGERQNVPLKPYLKNYEKYMMLPSVCRIRRQDLDQRLDRVERFGETYPYNRTIIRSTEMGIITSGVPSLYAQEVLPEASYLILGLTHPLPKKQIQAFAARVKKLYVVEELDPFLEEQIRGMGIPVIGKQKLPAIGELRPEVVARALKDGYPFPPERKTTVRPPARPPLFCPGCAHRPVFYALNKLKATVTGDIGCYALGAYPPLSAMDMNLCMGASIGVAHGMEKARTVNHEKRGRIVGVIGDSTFIHSGMTGLIDLVYNKGTATVLLLDNSTTAMTGHQEHPGTGKTLKGENTVGVDYHKVAELAGLRRVVDVNPYDYRQLYRVLKAELDSDEPSLVIAKAPCALTGFHKKRRPVTVDPDKCKQCGLCYQIGCPSIEKDPQGYATVNGMLCVGCRLCLQLCAHQAIQLVTEEGNP